MSGIIENNRASESTSGLANRGVADAVTWMWNLPCGAELLYKERCCLELGREYVIGIERGASDSDKDV